MIINKVKEIIAIDPGTIKAGIAYFVNEKLVKSEQINLKGKDIYDRLRQLKQALYAFKFNNCPLVGLCAVETQYIGRNPQSGLKIGQARGVALGVILENDCKIIDISPQEVRKYYGVSTRAKKEDYQKIVRLEHKALNMAEDEADAVAIGYTAIYKIKNVNLYNKTKK